MTVRQKIVEKYPISVSQRPSWQVLWTFPQVNYKTKKISLDICNATNRNSFNYLGNLSTFKTGQFSAVVLMDQLKNSLSSNSNKRELILVLVQLSCCAYLTQHISVQTHWFTCSLQRNLWMAFLPTVWILLRSSVIRASGLPSCPVTSSRPTRPSPASSRTRRITNRACMWAWDKQNTVCSTLPDPCVNSETDWLHWASSLELMIHHYTHRPGFTMLLK